SRGGECAAPDRGENARGAGPQVYHPGLLNLPGRWQKFKSLRRHPREHGLTPKQYRERWNLPSDYPMVAPNYSAARSELAKKMGLGKIRETPRKRGRPAKGR